MNDRNITNDLAVLGAGLLASSISSFLEHFAVLGMATEFARGLLDGLSVVAFCGAIFILVRGRAEQKSSDDRRGDYGSAQRGEVGRVGK